VTALPILIWFSTYIYELSFVKERFLFMGDQAVIGRFKINSAGRLKIWKLLVEKSSESPLFGHGIGSAEDLVIDYFGTIAQPHNEYLRVYFDFGVLGLILMLISFSWLFAANFKLRSDDLLMSWEFRLKWILLVQFLLFMSTDNPLVYPFFIFPVFFLVGFCTSTRKLFVIR
jgi:O-antigen ligase